MSIPLIKRLHNQRLGVIPAQPGERRIPITHREAPAPGEAPGGPAPSQEAPSRNARPRAAQTIALAALMLSSVILGVSVSTVAQDGSVWTTSFVSTGGSAVDQLAGDNDGERVGLTWRDAATNNIHFMLCSAAPCTSWTEKNADVSGVDTLTQVFLQHMTGSHWVLAGQTGSGVFYYHTANDGTTWTKGSTSIIGGSTQATHFDPCSDTASTGGLVAAYWSGSSDLIVKVSSDYGSTWGSTVDMSDNQGAGGTPTASISVKGGTVTAAECTTQVWNTQFVGTSDGDTYQTSTSGGFSTVPYTSNGGTTKDPVFTSCSTTAGDHLGTNAVATDTWLFDPSAGFDFICVHNGVTVQKVPPTPTDNVQINSNSANQGWHSTNSDNQELLAWRYGTAGIDDIYVWYRPDGGSYSQVYTATAADTAIYNLEQTETYGYFFYVNNAFGGRLDYAYSSIFTPETPLNPGHRFCADFGEENFGFDYVEQVTFEDDADFISRPGDFSLDDGFLFATGSGDSAFLGKGMGTVGSKAWSTIARLEAGSEGHSSLMRIAYTTGATALIEGASGDSGADMTTSGNGEDTGNFADSLQVDFEEHSAWRITMWSVIGGVRTQIGTSTSYGNPNTPTVFNFTVVNVESGAGIGNGMQAGFTMNLLDAGGNSIKFVNIPEALSDISFKDVWFVGTEGNVLALPDGIEPETILDNNDGDDHSTCMYDLIGTSTVTGSGGSEPGCISCPTTTSTGTTTGGPSAGDEDILGNPYFWVLLWILIICVIVAGLSWATRAGFGGIVYGVAIMIVYISGVLHYGTDQVSAWPIVAVISFVVGMAIWAGVRNR